MFVLLIHCQIIPHDLFPLHADKEWVAFLFGFEVILPSMVFELIGVYLLVICGVIVLSNGALIPRMKLTPLLLRYNCLLLLHLLPLLFVLLHVEQEFLIDISRVLFGQPLVVT